MQFALVATVIAAVAGLASAQLPGCAAECITNANTGSCGSDNKCLCESEAFVKSTGDCFIQKCQGEDQQKAFQISQELCRQAGVTSTSDFGSATQQPSQTHSHDSSATNSATNSATTGAATQSSTGNNGAFSLSSSSGLVLFSTGLLALAL